MTESAAMTERAVLRESAETSERAVEAEGADSHERAMVKEGTEDRERVASHESATTAERAGKVESAGEEERAAPKESAEVSERPRYRLGYPRIEVPSHHLWEAQQANWPDHLPHEAWQALVRIHNAEKQPVASSADHPAFRADYAPNYLASTEEPHSPEYLANRLERPRR